MSLTMPPESNTAISLRTVFQDRLALIFLLLYVCLGLYHLGVPSLWMDEVLVPMTAAHSNEFILNQSKYIEVHPPLFYFITKLALLVGSDDFTVRLFSVLCGLGTCIVGFAACCLVLPRPQARAALLFLIANSQFLFLARTARPYAFMVLLFSLILYLYLQYFESKKPDMVRVALLGGLLGLAFATVYTSIFLIAAVVGSMALVGTQRRKSGNLAAVVLLSLVAGLFLYFFYEAFISKSRVSQAYLDAGMDYATISAIYVNAIFDNIFYFNNLPARIGLGALTAWGLWLLRGNRPFCILTLALLLVPYAQLIVTKSALNFWGRHIAFLMLPMAMAQAAAAARLFGRFGTTAPVLAAATLSLLTLAGYHHKYFAVDSYDVEVIGDNYKSIAAHLAETAVPGEALNYTGEYLEKCTNWYVNRLLPAAARMNNPQADAPVASVIVAKEYLYLGGDKAGFRQRFGPFDTEEQYRSVTIYRRHVAKTGPVAMNGPLFRQDFTFDYTRLYAEAAAVSNVNVAFSARGFAVLPTRPDTPGTCDYVFTNPAGHTHFGVVLDYRSAGWGNVVAVDVRYDDEPFTTVFTTGGMDPRRQAIVPFHRDAPFATMTVRLRLVSHDSLPDTPGSGLRTVTLEGFTVIAADDEASVTRKYGPAAYNTYLLDNYETVRFPATSGIEQELVFDPEVVACRHPDDVEDKRAQVCALIPGQTAGHIDIRYRAPHNDAVFLPRVSGETTSLVAAVLDANGVESGFFTMHGISNTSWSPVAAQFRLPLPALTGAVRVKLQGGAQLWTVDGKALFRNR
ncbi:glycosyltransferase family 39 protein [Desulfovibrio sp. TomC]|uniref:glycosyltransferase family 39 protein n=1 Tax=Desulfovibrio sp. TomC TaxID=1562888 RepID=UPI000574B762|nr:glycosyltransferase family 39 protein [Desulfovibrio sp. TomC]KHK03079.1 putative inner membrane protein [Desulfovibrio sp. TomC]